MKNILVILFIYIFYSLTSAQTADLRFVEVLNDGTNYDVKLQIQGNSSFKLGSSNLKFNFNNTDLANPVLLVSHNFNNPPIYFEITITEPKPGIASANIELGFPTYGTTVGTTWTDIVTIRFTILSTVATTQLTWRNMNPPEFDNPTVIFLDSEASQVTQGVFNSLNTSPLPVELTSFSLAQKDENTLQLNWETATEVNNYGFEIERASSTTSPVTTDSSDIPDNSPSRAETREWEKIGFVEGHGNSNSPNSYNFVDDNLTGGNHFTYRLKQLDIDGTYEYSDLVDVSITPKKYELSQNYPNPFNPSTTIKFSLPQTGKVRLDIYNMIGERVATLIDKEMDAGFQSVQFNASNLASGIYFYMLQSGKYIQSKKMILLK